MNFTRITAAALLGVASLAALAATDGGKPPLVQHKPKLPEVIVGANACGADWKRVHLTATSVTCEFKPRGRPCGSFGPGTPLNDGAGRFACMTQAGGGGSQTREQRCGSGWRLTVGSLKPGKEFIEWSCEPDAGGIKCPSGWVGPYPNALQTGGSLTMVCQVPPK